MEKRCDTCVNYHATGKDWTMRPGREGEGDGHPAGECRIGPPQPTHARGGGRWPLVFADEWCGCWIERDPAPATLPFPTDRVGPVPPDGGISGPPDVIPFRRRDHA